MIGTYVIINKEGWVVTAGHIIRQWVTLAREVEVVTNTPARRKLIEDDTTIERHERKRRLAEMPRVTSDSNDACSAWWGFNGVQLRDFSFINAEAPGFGDIADVGIGRLEPFDPAWVTTYPVFKDPKKDFEPGVSLCKLGFPFHSITPTWEASTKNFILPEGALPLPRFPIEGIFTRVIEMNVPDISPPPEFPIRYVETSSPGLKGQSGGPTIDMRGTVWAIQAKTNNLPLGFDPPVPGGKPGQREHQFLNVGLGVHPDTFFWLFNQAGLSYDISDY